MTKRRYVTIYLGNLEEQALQRCPKGMQRGRWVNVLAAQLTTWPESQWNALLANLAPRPSPRTGKLSTAIRPSLVAELDKRRGQVSLSDVLRTALLRAGKIGYRPIPTVAPFALSSAPTSGELTISGAASLVSARPPPPVQVVLPKQLAFGDHPEGEYWDARPFDAPPAHAAKLRQMVVESKINPATCFPDLIPTAQWALAKHLMLAPSNRLLNLNLGITVENSGEQILTGLADSERTEHVLFGILEHADRPIRCKVIRYRYGSDPEDVLLGVAIRTITPRSKLAKRQWIEAFGVEDIIDRLEAVRLEERQRILELEARCEALEKRKEESEKTLEDIIEGLRKDLVATHRSAAELDASAERAAAYIYQLKEQIEDLGETPERPE